MPEKHPDTRRESGPGASHKNRKTPQKSKPHGELNKRYPEQGNSSAGKSGGDGREHT
jgi:hypothetical protein